MGKVDRAVSCFKEGFNCSQAILSTYGPELGLDRDSALRIACAFGGGTARMGEACGAVTGSIMALGLKHGTQTAGDAAAKEKTYGLVRGFVRSFKARNGSIVCRDLLGCDISEPEGMNQAEEENLFDTICPGLVRDAAEILEAMGL